MAPSRVRRAAAVAAATAVGLASCGGGSNRDAAPDSRLAGTAEVGVVAEVLQFSAPTVGGGSLDLATLGDRPVLFWFWAPF